MSSYRYFWFYLGVVALLVTHASARAPSEDTPIDQIISCVYPMSGQYELLPRLLFYVSLIFASTIRRSGWFANIVLGLAMSYSTTAFVHIIVIYATHGWHPPILDLDVLGIYLLATVSVSMYPALVVLQWSRYKSRAMRVVVRCWWQIMFLMSILATVLLNNLKNPQHNSNAEVACYLLDNTLLTSLAQLNGTRDLECIYDCFLTRESVLKAQDAVTVMWGTPMSNEVGNWGLMMGGAFSNIMLLLGSHIFTYPRVLKLLGALLLKPVYSVYNQDKRAIMTVIVYICLISVAPWVTMIEYSLWSMPVEEKSFAIGQWGPWVGAVFAIIGGAMYHVLKDHEKAPEPALYGICVDSPAGYMMSGALTEPGGNIPMVDLPKPGKEDDIAPLNDEMDIGTCIITPADEVDGLPVERNNEDVEV